jgi:putative transposase
LAAAFAQGQWRSTIEAVPATLLDRQYAAEKPNQKWIAEFTCLWTARVWLYVAAVIVLVTVCGVVDERRHEARLVTDALLMVV